MRNDQQIEFLLWRVHNTIFSLSCFLLLLLMLFRCGWLELSKKTFYWMPSSASTKCAIVYGRCARWGNFQLSSFFCLLLYFQWIVCFCCFLCCWLLPLMCVTFCERQRFHTIDVKWTIITGFIVQHIGHNPNVLQFLITWKTACDWKTPTTNTCNQFNI